MYQLPVSHVNVSFRQPNGTEDILLLESPSGDAHLALELCQRLADAPDLDWLSLPLTDLDALLLTIRQTVIGSSILSDVLCTACDTRFDVRFAIPRISRSSSSAARQRDRRAYLGCRAGLVLSLGRR